MGHYGNSLLRGGKRKRQINAFNFGSSSVFTYQPFSFPDFWLRAYWGWDKSNTKREFGSARLSTFLAHNTRSFADGHELIGGHGVVAFMQTIGPEDLQVHNLEFSQSEMKPRIV